MPEKSQFFTGVPKDHAIPDIIFPKTLVLHYYVKYITIVLYATMYPIKAGQMYPVIVMANWPVIV